MEEAISSDDEGGKLRAGQLPGEIDDANEFIAWWEARKIVDLGLPDSFAYQDDESICHLFLHRQGRLFYIRAYGKDEAQKQDTAWLRQLMSRFRAREAFEIPTEPGVCYPYAFLADDGTGDYHAKATFRYPDRPGVVYTLDTGLVVGVDSGVARRPQPAALWAGTLSATGLLAGPLTAGRKQEIIGLRAVAQPVPTADHTHDAGVTEAAVAVSAASWLPSGKSRHEGAWTCLLQIVSGVLCRLDALTHLVHAHGRGLEGTYLRHGGTFARHLRAWRWASGPPCARRC